MNKTLTEKIEIKIGKEIYSLVGMSDYTMANRVVDNVMKIFLNSISQAKKEGAEEMWGKTSRLMVENSFDTSQLAIDRKSFNLLISPKPISNS